MSSSIELTNDQALWLSRILDANVQGLFFDYSSMPEVIHDALIDKGLITWRAGALEITAAGSFAIAMRSRRA
jgi:hypothetical protein